jgi:hypothetical protein
MPSKSPCLHQALGTHYNFLDTRGSWILFIRFSLKFLWSVPGDNALDHIDDILSDIGGMIGNPFQVS